MKREIELILEYIDNNVKILEAPLSNYRITPYSQIEELRDENIKIKQEIKRLCKNAES